eukprot:5534891-Pleurochrysis_carterae.AAC.3
MPRCADAWSSVSVSLSDLPDSSCLLLRLSRLSTLSRAISNWWRVSLSAVSLASSLALVVRSAASLRSSARLSGSAAESAALRSATVRAAAVAASLVSNLSRCSTSSLSFLDASALAAFALSSALLRSSALSFSLALALSSRARVSLSNCSFDLPSRSDRASRSSKIVNSARCCTSCDSSCCLSVRSSASWCCAARHSCCDDLSARVLPRHASASVRTSSSTLARTWRSRTPMRGTVEVFMHH